jgi:hypothetical protein
MDSGGFLLVFLFVLALLLFGGIALFIGVGEALFNWRRQAKEERRGWRIRRTDAGLWAYEEQTEGRWIGVLLDDVGGAGESQRKLALPSPDAWQFIPEWLERRDEIENRIRSELPEYVVKSA